VISILLFSLPSDLKKNKYGPVITVEKKSVKKKTKANNKKKKK